MKTITLFFFILITTIITANAQITKENWLVGGTGGYSNIELKDQDGNKTGKSSTLFINPNIGYFFLDKFAAGLNGQFNYGKTENGPSNTSYGIGPFARYYFLKTDNQINAFVHGSYIYFSENGRNYVFKAGPVLYFNNSVGLELTLNYDSTKFFDSYESSGFRIGLGFQIHLEK